VEQQEAATVVPAEEAQPPADEGAVELPPVAPTGLGPGTASGGTSVSTDPAQPTVRWRHVVYAVGYVLLGLLMIAIQPIVGGLAVVAGLVLGGYSLRPLFAASRTQVNRP
jgi:hypothetical protein